MNTTACNNNRKTPPVAAGVDGAGWVAAGGGIAVQRLQLLLQ